MSDIHFEWHMDDFEAAIDKRVYNVRDGTRQEMNDLKRDVKNMVDIYLERHAHPPGTKTPSPPGEPPGSITGNLGRSVTSSGLSAGSYVSQVMSALSNSSWSFTIGPTAVYGRIQELGGRTGKHHRTYLPPRPYFKPAIEDVVSTMKYSITRIWRNTWSRGF